MLALYVLFYDILLRLDIWGVVDAVELHIISERKVLSTTSVFQFLDEITPTPTSRSVSIILFSPPDPSMYTRNHETQRPTNARSFDCRVHGWIHDRRIVSFNVLLYLGGRPPVLGVLSITFRSEMLHGMSTKNTEAFHIVCNYTCEHTKPRKHSTPIEAGMPSPMLTCVEVHLTVRTTTKK